MARAEKPAPSTPFQAVEHALLRQFDGVVSMSDFTGQAGEQTDLAFRSRALAALVVRMKTDCDAQTAALMIADGGEDQGIDAYAFAEHPAHVWLIQAKWKANGTGNLDGRTVKDVLDGVQRIDKEQFHWFNARAEPLARQAKAYVQERAARMTVTFAVMGSQEPHPGTIADLERRIDDLNQDGAWLDYEILRIPDYYRWLRDDAAPKPVTLSIGMERWREEGTPYKVVSGSVLVADVAQWYGENQQRLFDLNVRHPLGLTAPNKALIRTLTEEPQNFQYFNNGITIVCDDLRVTPKILSARYSGSVSLDAEGASIVNGAQTVKSIAEAMQIAPESASQARVDVRVIETRNAPPGFALGVTDATNRQNRIEARDFIALDPVQSDIRIDMALLELDYVVKRGEPAPDHEDGCTIVDAAIALALAYPEPRLAYRLGRSEDVLWERGDEGIYDIVFGQAKPHPHRLWRCVQTYRAVARSLRRTRNERESRAAELADLGLNLLSHLVFRQLPMEQIEDPKFGWEDEVLEKIDPIVDEMLRRAMQTADDEFSRFSIGAILRDASRFEDLATGVIQRLKSGGSAPELAHQYRRTGDRRKRSSNAVHVLIDAGAIQEDTELRFGAQTGPEQRALAAWLAAEPKRTTASWENRRSTPLRWHADGKLYSPSGLADHMYDLAEWEGKPKANQGTIRWFLESGETLASLAYRIRHELSTDDEEREPPASDSAA